jgi:hypothetical protein
LVASGEDQIAAFGGEGAGDGESDAAGGASDEGGLVAEAVVRRGSGPQRRI